MADLHHLPAPALPEGWEPCPSGVRRAVPSGGGTDILNVWRSDGSFCGWPAVKPTPHVLDAIAAVERAYCNCGIKEVKRG